MVHNGLIWFGAGLSIAEILTGTAFAPMIAIQIADYFILKSDKSSKKADITNAVIWVIGFILYRYLMTVEDVYKRQEIYNANKFTKRTEG